MPFRTLRSVFSALVALTLSAEVLVTLEPKLPVLQAGASLAFKAKVLNARHPGCLWLVTGAGGHITPEGVFTGAPGTYTVRVSSAFDPRFFAETRVSVLPDQDALRLVEQVQGRGSFAPGWSDALPFHDLAGYRRFGEPHAKVEELKGAPLGYPQILGYGLKVPVQLPRMGVQPEAQLVSYFEGGEPVRVDATGGHQVLVCARGPVTGARVEALNRSGGRAWMSRIHPLDLRVRGLIPLAGNPVAGPGDQDGRGLSARFRGPHGLAVLENGMVIVADPEAHVVRVILPDGQAQTYWGRPGEPGHQDGWEEAARFRGPTFVTAHPSRKPLLPWLGSPCFLVSDSGNHVVRAVDELGRVRTVAGTPGQAGYCDDPDPRKALFHDPRGLGVDPAGTIYVADRGNQVVRRISAAGEVTTLAGRPGASGALDGRGPEALFTGLKGLVVTPAGLIGVVDGHSVRIISPAGDVVTLCGNPAEPGAGPGRTGAVGPGEPCLNHPEGLAVMGRDLLISDRGNHALRFVRLGTPGLPELGTLAGDPGLAASRYGLLRFGIEGPLGPEYGALGAPTGIAAHGYDVYVADGPSVVRCSEAVAVWGLARPELLVADGGWVAPGVALEIEFLGPRALAEDPTGYEPEPPIQYFWTLDSLDPVTRAPVAAQVKGEAWQPRGAARVTFEDKGPVELQLTCVTAEGLSMKASARLKVE
jgi:hypothetical protein